MMKPSIVHIPNNSYSNSAVVKTLVEREDETFELRTTRIGHGVKKEKLLCFCDFLKIIEKDLARKRRTLLLVQSKGRLEHNVL